MPIGRRTSKTASRSLFIDRSGQTEIFEKSVEQEILEARPVECLGQTFPNDAARREHFLGKLRDKLKDPEFRKIEGFPIGLDEDILRMSDPPYYTACPNPFLEDFVRCYGRPYDPAQPYHREPFAVDTSVGKTDPLYKAHGYHTKVPHLAIVPSILHYTNPGDIVLDGFCGSGMTGVAAQWCGGAPAAYRLNLEAQWKAEGRRKPEWGARRVILNDLGPAATFISAGYNLPFDVSGFRAATQRILEEVGAELGWMYETVHKDGQKCRINYTVWSEVFTCPDCGGEVVFVDEAFDKKLNRMRDEFPCPHCRTSLDKDHLQRHFETRIDPATGQPWKRVSFRAIRINYSGPGGVFDKVPDAADLKVLQKIERMPLPVEIPTIELPLDQMYHGSRLGPKGFTRLHHLFQPRALQSLGTLWRKATSVQETSLRRSVLWFIEQAIVTMTLQNRFQPQGYKQVNKSLPGVYYVPSQHCEISPWYAIASRGIRIAAMFAQVPRERAVAITTTSCVNLRCSDDSIDYVFTDPPFGENIPYADLNFLVEAWHRVFTNVAPEAIVDHAKKKGLSEYQELMRRCFEEYFRVLKPGRWMTVVFSNSSNAVWRAIQEGLGRAGFVVADVRTLDKEQGSYRQVTSSAVKQDLVISAYKPTEKLAAQFKLGRSSEAGAWAFVAEHLENVPVFVGSKQKADIVIERTPQMLHDRMIAYHVQRGLAVPIGTANFLAGLKTRFPDRDGMCFLPHQVAEYDRKRMAVGGVKQLELSVNDERSAIVWLRNELSERPRSFQELQPPFMKELQAWARHERTVELKEILAQNFLSYEGRGPVPAQIHSYLSTNFRECRNLDKNDSILKDKALDRWYVPDPGKQGDLEKIRDRALLKEFDAYRESKEKKLKVFRTEAVRAGFKAAYDAKEYAAIIEVAAKLPEAVLQEDETLLMYFDVATMRTGDE